MGALRGWAFSYERGTPVQQVELVHDNIFEWHVTLLGAKGSFYAGEKFKLRSEFSPPYFLPYVNVYEGVLLCTRLI